AYRTERTRRSLFDEARFSAWNCDAPGIRTVVRHPHISAPSAGSRGIRCLVRATAVRPGSSRETQYPAARASDMVASHPRIGKVAERVLQALGFGYGSRLGQLDRRGLHTVPGCRVRILRRFQINDRF